MNRQIEFRVWDKLLNKMMKDQPYIDFDNPEYIFLEFTGLFDSQGNKIFEGDILEMRGTKSQYTVYFDKFSAGFKLTGTYGKHVARFTLNDHVHAKDLTVVGNIFENLQLISPKT